MGGGVRVRVIWAGLASDAKMALARPREAFVPDLYEKAARAPASTGPKGREHLGAGRGAGVRGEGEGCLGPGRVVVWRTEAWGQGGLGGREAWDAWEALGRPGRVLLVMLERMWAY